MSEVNIEAGFCLGFGGTNARTSYCEAGDISGFSSVETPTQPEEFFKWMARSILDASHDGSKWAVAGFPGPVSQDGVMVGPLNNVSGMNTQQYNLSEELFAADPEINQLLEDGFILLAVNDGTLAAHAAAARVGEHAYGKTGALIFGTGVGAGVVEKDPAFDNVHRVDTSNPLEIGHLIMSNDPYDRFEDRFSGPGLFKRYGVEAKDLPYEHPAWVEQGAVVGKLATYLGLMNGVELVVPTGGLGIGAADKYIRHLDAFYNAYAAYGNAPQKVFLPDIRLADHADVDVFEMYGAEGVILEHTTR